MSTSLPLFAMPLAATLAAAAIIDARSARIPNLLSLGVLLLGLAVQASVAGWPGLRTGGAGVLVGFACLAPFHLLRGMGAGDVKLLAATGAWLGAPLTLVAALLTLIAGAVIGLGVFSAHLYRNHGARGALVQLAYGPLLKTASGIRFPYAVAILLGVCGAIAAARGGYLPAWATPFGAGAAL